MRLFATALVSSVVIVLAASAARAADPIRHHLDGIPGQNVAGRGLFEATFPAIQDNVFSPSCALGPCHAEAMQAGLDLRPGAAYAMLVNVPSLEVPQWDRIEPFDPDQSYLICKLENCPSIVGSQMPLIGGPLDQAVIDIIREWVLLGAPEEPGIAVEATSWGSVKASYR